MTWAWVFAFGTMAHLVRAAPPDLPQYALKAQILVELLPYVQFPAEGDRPEQPFLIAVLGKSPFGLHLDDYARPRTIHRRPIRIRYVSRLAEAEGCDAVFICRSEAERLDGILAWAQARKVLTLSDDEGLARRGVMVSLVIEGRQIRIVVNQEDASQAGVTLGSQILRNARLLPPRPRPTPASKPPAGSGPSLSAGPGGLP